METIIKRATDEITAGSAELPVQLTPLLECATKIAEEAILSRSGELRDIALRIAKDIADYDYELRRV